MLACLLIELVTVLHVPVYAIRKLSEKRCVSALLVIVGGAGGGGGLRVWLFVPGRGESASLYRCGGTGAVLCPVGHHRESRAAMKLPFGIAGRSPPYLVTETPRGACSRGETCGGFYTTAMRDDYASRLQTVPAGDFYGRAGIRGPDLFGTGTRN